tara:strand:- start:255 stop:464 length:210 start_codon:yes stop_codon:yes gene_type:complete
MPEKYEEPDLDESEQDLLDAVWDKVTAANKSRQIEAAKTRSANNARTATGQGLQPAKRGRPGEAEEDDT